jgi:hypothetical protein
MKRHVRVCLVTSYSAWQSTEQLWNTFEILIHYHQKIIIKARGHVRRYQWPRGLRHRSAAARLLRSWFRIPPGAWMYICCECCVLSGRGLCDELITRPEESYRLWCFVVCNLEISILRRSRPALGRSATERNRTWLAFPHHKYGRLSQSLPKLIKSRNLHDIYFIFWLNTG